MAEFMNGMYRSEHVIPTRVVEETIDPLNIAQLADRLMKLEKRCDSKDQEISRLRMTINRQRMAIQALEKRLR